ncbi:hypothetical protein QE152_g40002 [Popillia japonica]|uniref:Uncharacterized protein n=1 Tax=Popillia japonica TaxID=7064 RepID=A0AAW1HT81_POPJA
MLLELADCGCIRYQPTNIGTTAQGFMGGTVTREPYISEDCERVFSAIAEAVEELVCNEPKKPHETGAMEDETMKYRKKPVVIEAVQWTGMNLQEIKDFVGNACKTHLHDSAWQLGVGAPMIELKIRTLEGDMLANQGDYIIKGVQGEYYPCKPEIFRVLPMQARNIQTDLRTSVNAEQEEDMKLFLLWQNVNEDYDTFDSCLVAADDVEDAKTITPCVERHCEIEWAAVEHIQCECIGDNAVCGASLRNRMGSCRAYPMRMHRRSS